MLKVALPAISIGLLITSCGTTGASESIEASSTPSASAASEPSPTEATTAPATEEPTTDPAEVSAEDQLEEALTDPEVTPVDTGDPAASFLATYKEQLQTLPEGPHAQLGTDADSLALGYQACEDLSVMSHGEALFAYAFSDATEEQVADYNAALNSAPGTLC